MQNPIRISFILSVFMLACGGPQTTTETTTAPPTDYEQEEEFERGLPDIDEPGVYDDHPGFVPRTPLTQCADIEVDAAERFVRVSDPLFAAISRNGPLMWVAHSNGMTESWSIEGEPEPVVQENGRLIVDVDDDWLYSLDIDGTTARLARVVGNEEVAVRDITYPIISGAISPDAAMLAFIACDEDAAVVAMAQPDGGGVFSSTSTLPCPEMGSVRMVVTNDNRVVWGTRSSGTLNVYDGNEDAYTSTPVHMPRSEHEPNDYEPGILSLALSPDGMYVATAGTDRRVVVTELSTGTATHTLESEVATLNSEMYVRPIPASSVAWVQSGEALLYIGPDFAPRIHTLATGEELMLEVPTIQGTQSDFARSVPAILATDADGTRVSALAMNRVLSWSCAGDYPASDQPEPPEPGEVLEDDIR